MGQRFESKTLRWVLRPAAWIAAAAVLAGCGGGSVATTASPGASPASIDSLIAKSKSETGLVIYGNIPDTYFTPVTDGFKAAYPGINIQYSDLTDPEVFSKYQAERAQGARTADVLIASAPALWIQAETSGLISKITPQGMSKFPSFTTQAPGLFVMSPDPVISAYNTKLLSASSAPDSYSGLVAAVKANPSKYSLVSYAIDDQYAYGAIYGLIKILGWDTYWALQDQLAANTKTYNEGLTQLTQVATGAANYGYIGSGLGQQVIPLVTHGLVQSQYMKDATPLVPRGIAVTAGATSPSSAQLFLDYIFSDAGQQTLCTVGFEAAENNFVPSNGCIANLAALQKAVPNSKIYLVPMNQDVLDQQSKIVARWNQSFHR